MERNEKNNPTIALNVLYVKKRWMYIKSTFQRKTQTMKNNSFFQMILNGEAWYYIAVKRLSALLRGIT